MRVSSVLRHRVPLGILAIVLPCNQRKYQARQQIILMHRLDNDPEVSTRESSSCKLFLDFTHQLFWISPDPFRKFRGNMEIGKQSSSPQTFL
ncbi:MAG: hypothetical protein ACLFQR_09840 [Desulfovibrionales bacterium]